MSKKSKEELEEILDGAVSGLKSISSKKMFGCHAVWVKDNVFALVWKTGRIGVKLPTESDYDSLMSKKGSAPWTAGPKKMAHWVLVPESYHSRTSELKKWTNKAHALCSKLESKPKKKAPAKKAKAKKGR